MIGDNETNFPHKLLLTNRQVSNLRKAFANHSSADIKLSKTRLSKMIQSGGFLGTLVGPLLKTGLLFFLIWKFFIYFFKIRNTTQLNTNILQI